LLAGRSERLARQSEPIGQIRHLALALAKTDFGEHRKTAIDIPLTANDVVVGLLGGLRTNLWAEEFEDLCRFVGSDQRITLKILTRTAFCHDSTA